VGDGAYKRLGKSSLPRRFAPASLRPDATPLMNRDQRKKSPCLTSLHELLTFVETVRLELVKVQKSNAYTFLRI
jgi:hypothetical protein